MAQLPPLISFTAGSPAVAGDVNQNFTDIRNHLNGANVDTENIAATLLSRSGGPILNLSQLTENQIAFNVENSQTNTAVSISQLALLATGKSILKLSETVAQTQGDAQLFLSLQSLSTIPAIHVTHGGVDSLKLTKDGLKPPVKTTAQRNAIISPEEGSVIYNSTNQELNVRQSSLWTPVGCPIGSIQMFAGASAPQGWLICNGDTVPNGSGTVQTITADYSQLYAVLGSTYGSAGKLPDIRGMFVRGAGTNTTIKKSRYTFTIASSSVTAGAVYSNNTQTFTVLTTISSSTTLVASGTGAPQVSGTLTKVSGTGPATIAFSAYVQYEYSGVLGQSNQDTTAINGLISEGAGGHSHMLLGPAGDGNPNPQVGTLNGQIQYNISNPAYAYWGHYNDQAGGKTEPVEGNTGNTLVKWVSNHTHPLTGDTETRPANIALNYIIKY